MPIAESSELARQVIERLSECTNPRFKQILTALVCHLQAFVDEVGLTAEERMAAIPQALLGEFRTVRSPVSFDQQRALDERNATVFQRTVFQ